MEQTEIRATVVVKGVSMKPEHWAMIDSHARDTGLISRSAALRAILDDWAKMHKAGLVGAFLPAKEPS
jgi:hypothetical protein